ncbi:bifunctional DNA primase/polymerase [Streptomyces sp. NRRL B-24484]|uniref:bifunctional DNA primase/polymerase n=1 Tax=Streptomyces sp. NRRL B-24484 TaxID=1463833 RepID=UPI0004C1BEE4|nr:bifunctional DNA primase/polymerase [Streptomyces sp. NRRL B-24484]
MTARPDLLAAALASAQRGWPVFPLRPDDKRPALHHATRCPRTGPCTAGHASWEQRATVDPDAIRRAWEHGPYNVGLATGPARLVVVDLDVPKHPGDTPPPRWAELGVTDGADVLAALCEQHHQPYPADTRTVRTCSGGTHLYFTAPPGLVLRNTRGEQGNGLGWKVDTRAAGGYVVAPGSLVEGRPYTVEHDAEPAPLPTWLAALLTPPPPRPLWRPVNPSAGRGSGHGYVAAALLNETANVAAAGEGARNWTLTRAARALGRFVADGRLTRAEVEDALKGAGEACGLPARDVTATITNALNWSIANNPRGEAA